MYKEILSKRNDLAKIINADCKPKIAAVCHLLERGESVDEKEIERLLDGLLDYGYDNEVVELFNQLCHKAEKRYPQLVKDYTRYFANQWTED